MYTIYQSKKLLLAILTISFFIINSNDIKAQNKIGSIEILNKGKGFLSEGACNMNVYVKKIRLEPGEKIDYIIWPEWHIAGTIQPGETLKLYVNDNERLMVRVSSSNLSDYFWGYGILFPGQVLRYELLCK